MKPAAPMIRKREWFMIFSEYTLAFARKRDLSRTSPVLNDPMQPAALRHYRCTNCGDSGLAIEPVSAASAITEGTIICVKCGRSVEVRAGIPRFVPPENYARTFGYQWNIHRKTQLDSYTGLPISRTRLFAATGWPQNLRGQMVLEAGSGAGRFTEVLLSTGATVFSFDYSSAVDANFANNGNHSNLHLFQGDIFNIPLRRESFDKVLCLGVIQHTPDPETAFANLAAMTKPGGELVIDVYTKAMRSLLQWKYALRPVTKRMHPEKLYKIVEAVVPALLPAAAALRRVAGRVGARLVPIVEYSHLGLPAQLNREWAVLDTFDMYSPAHDHPQSLRTVRHWFERAGFVDVVVEHGPNGVVGKGKRAPLSCPEHSQKK
jgi:SAM-dependent methyltransferase